MNERVRPTPEANERVRNLGEKAVLSFLDEVSSINDLVDYLPSVHGFRKNSDAGIKREKLALAKKLTSKVNGDDRAQLALYVIWHTWGQEHLGDPVGIERILDELEEAEPVTGDENEPQTPNFDEQVIALFTALKNLSLENKCSREKIERFFSFSPFSAIAGLSELINSAKAAVDVERDSAISALPKRLRKNEEEIQRLKETQQALSTQLASIISDVGEVTRNVDELRPLVRAAGTSSDEVRASLGAALARIKANADATAALTRDLSEVRKEMRTPPSDGDDQRIRLKEALAELESRFRQAIATAIAPLDQKLAGISPVGGEALDSLAEALSQLAAQVTSISDTAISQEEWSAITARVETLEQAPMATASHGESSIEKPAAHAAAAPSIPAVVKPIPAKAGGIAKKLDAVAKIVEVLGLALQCLGLKKTPAEGLAGEITAAVLSNQVIFFKGSIGAIAAQLCALALSSDDAWRLPVPIGLTEGELVRTALDHILAKRSAAVPSLMLEGLNRSSFDAVKDSLAEFTVDHETMGNAKVICFASLVHGVASLPVEPEFLELGPIFDLDHLDWRVQPDRNLVLPAATVLRETELALRKRVFEGPADTDEATRLLNKFSRKRNVRIERTIDAACRVLQHIRRPNASPTALQSLAFGWLIPLWLAWDVSKDEADLELDGGKLDSEKGVADPRIASILAGGEFGGAEAEASE